MPLMPARDTSAEIPRGENAQQRNSKKSSAAGPGLAGIEFGMYGAGGVSSKEALGLQWLWGGRISYRLPVFSQFRFRPSLGYFRKSQSEGAVSISQSLIDLGLGADWLLIQKKSVDLSVGIFNHIDAVFSRVSLYDASGSSPLSFRYRVAPAAGMQVHLSPQLILTADLEYGFIPQDPMRTYGAWALGLAFPF